MSTEEPTMPFRVGAGFGQTLPGSVVDFCTVRGPNMLHLSASELWNSTAGREVVEP